MSLCDILNCLNCMNYCNFFLKIKLHAFAEGHIGELLANPGLCLVPLIITLGKERGFAERQFEKRSAKTHDTCYPRFRLVNVRLLFFAERFILTHGKDFAECTDEMNSAKSSLPVGPMPTQFADGVHSAKPLPSVLQPLPSVFGTWQTQIFP